MVFSRESDMHNKFKQWNWIALVCGLVSNLFVTTPVGRVAMLDIAAYVCGPLFLLQDFSRQTKVERRMSFFALLWLFGGVLSDMVRGTPFDIALKGDMIIFNAACLFWMGCGICRRSPGALVWFTVSAAMSTFISLYYFQNGALLSQAIRLGGMNRAGALSDFLVAKMKYPIYFGVGMYTCLMPLRLRGWIPWWICIGGYFAFGVFILLEGEGRSSCLIMVASAGMMFLYAYAPKILSIFFRNRIRTILVVLIAAVAANYSYYGLAKMGLLGEAGLKKYEERMSGETSALDDRADLLINWPFLWRSPLVGAGCEFIDRWGYVDASPHVAHVDAAGRFIHHEKFFGHSCLVGAWTQCGIWGLFFWLYAMMLLIKVFGERIQDFGDFGPFLMALSITFMWSIMFSPYGMFRGRVMFLLAFLCIGESPIGRVMMRMYYTQQVDWMKRRMSWRS